MPTLLAGPPDFWDVAFCVVSAVCWSLVTPLAIVINSFNLLGVHRSRDPDDVHRIFVATINLFVLASCLCFALPATISATAGGLWTLGDFLCLAQSLLVVYLQCVCSLLLLSYSLERYFFLVHPMRYLRLVTATRVRRLIAGILVLTVLDVVVCGLLSGWTAVYVPACQVCAPSMEPAPSKVLFASFFTLLSVVPSVVGYLVHVALLLTVRRHLRRIRAGIPQCAAAPNRGTHHASNDEESAVDRRQRMADFARKIRVNRARLILLTIFSPIATGVYMLLDLAFLGYSVPRYVVLLGNLGIFSVPTLLGLKVIMNGRNLKETFRQVCSCHCQTEA